MISVTKKPYAHFLCDNPVVFDGVTDDQLVAVIISVDNRIVRHLSYVPTQTGRFSIDLSEVLHEFVSTSIPLMVDKLLIPIIDMHKQVTVAINGYNNGIVNNTGNFREDYTVYNGGVSYTIFDILDKQNSCFMRYRLQNHTRQFVFTTRTNSRNISMRETEIMPLVFIHPGVNVAFVTDRGRMLIPPLEAANKLVAINVDYIRKLTYNTYKEIPCYFSVLVNDSYIFDVSITKAMNTSNRRVLSFKNSLGMFEKIEITGDIKQEDEFEEATEFSYFSGGGKHAKLYTDRKSVSDIRKADLGFKSKEELFFLRDLLCSDEVYINDSGGSRRVLISADEISYNTAFETPQSISISIKMAEKDSLFTTDLDFGIPSVKFGEWILKDDRLNGYGFLYDNYKL